MLTLTATIVSVPVALREQLEALSGKMALLRHLAALRPGPLASTTASARTSRHRLNRRGHRQADAALYRVVVVRMRTHQLTIDYARRRIAEGKSKPEVIRCLKRFVVREVFGHLCQTPKALSPAQIAA